MLFDDNADSSPSSAEYLQSPHEAKRKALMRKLEQKGMKDAANKSGADLQTLKLALLKGQMDKKADKSNVEKDKQNAGKMATKTREQEIASSKLTVDTKPSAEQLVKQGTQDQKSEERLKADEVQTEDA